MSGTMRAWAMTVLAGIALAAMLLPSAAFGSVLEYKVSAEEDGIHYGNTAYTNTGYMPMLSIQKVKSIWTSRTDLSGWCEIGLTYDIYGVQPVQFVAWEEHGLYDDEYFNMANWNSSQRFHVGYDTSDGFHYFWIQNEIVAALHNSYVNGMTSSWPRTLAEADLLSGTPYDNDASFTGLRWKDAAWGVWKYWGTSGRTYQDNDPNNSNHIGNNTVDVF